MAREESVPEAGTALQVYWVGSFHWATAGVDPAKRKILLEPIAGVALLQERQNGYCLLAERSRPGDSMLTAQSPDYREIALPTIESPTKRQRRAAQRLMAGEATREPPRWR